MRIASMVLVACVVAGVGCRRAAPQESPLRPTATVKDIMDSMVDPSADALWESVETLVNAKGTTERRPSTDEEWAALHRRAVELVEATNLLLMEGRHVAKPGEKAENKDVELSPEEIEAIINQDRKSWTEFAHKLHDAALPALRAVENRNADALLDAGGDIDTACENCHLKYWYPASKQADEARRGSVRKR
jgi:cytochrome c556